MIRAILYSLGILVLCAAPAALLFVVPLSSGITAHTALMDFLRLQLMSAAFVGALWAAYLKDTRLRALSENILVVLIAYISAIVMVSGSILCSGFTSTSPSWWNSGRDVLLLYSLWAYILACFSLIMSVFANTYNHVYNLRTNKFLKYVKPIRFFRSLWPSNKPYEYDVEKRSIKTESSLLTALMSIRRVDDTNGAAFLLRGPISSRVLEEILQFLVDRLQDGDTVNVVSCREHPCNLWRTLRARGAEPHRQRFVFIDGYSPAFGFTDDIHDRNAQMLQEVDGVPVVAAKTFAGLHTATNNAFNRLKKVENDAKRNRRRPTVMLYAHVSALCELESNEQCRIFWRHVIPSERNYGMLTIVLEDTLAPKDILDTVTQLVDGIIVATEKDGVVEFHPQGRSDA